MFDLIVLFGFRTDENNIVEVKNFIEETEAIYDPSSKAVSPIYFLAKLCFYFGFSTGIIFSSIASLFFYNLQ